MLHSTRQQVRGGLLAGGVATVVLLTLTGSVPESGSVAATDRPRGHETAGPDDHVSQAAGRSVPLRAVPVPGPALAPGSGHALDVRVSNPNVQSVLVTTVEVGVREVRSPRAKPDLPCGLADFTTRAGEAVEVRVGPGDSVSLSSADVPRRQWPWVGMVASETNQDGCQDAQLLLDVRVEGELR